MNDLTKTIGRRLRNYRTAQNLSQEKLAEMAGCHPTYIGQLERGEKNATLESLAKVATALKIPLSRLFETPGDEPSVESFALKCYEFVAERSPTEQAQLYYLLLEIDRYKQN